eukprot:gene5737-6027_t
MFAECLLLFFLFLFLRVRISYARWLTVRFSHDSQPVSKRVANAKSSKFHENVHKRGIVPDPALKKKNKIGVDPVTLGIILFVVIGSALIGIIQTASSNNAPQ